MKRYIANTMNQKFREIVMERLEYNMQLFREMITCTHNIYCSEFDLTYNPVYSTAGEEDKWMLAGLFAMGMTDIDKNGGPQEYRDASRMQGVSRPAFCTNTLGMAWISESLLVNGKVEKIYVLGPVFLEDFSLQKVEKRMDYLQVSILRKREFMKVIERLPVLPMMRFKEYGLMMHYCLYGEKLSDSDYEYIEERNVEINNRQERTIRRTDDRYRDEEHSSNIATYELEQQLLRLIEEGNMNYREVKKKLVAFGNVGKISEGDYLYEMRKHVMIFTALCTRAAIRGGLDPEIAYQLSDMYIRNLERCKTIAELTETDEAMMNDFVRRVHRLKLDAGISPQIQNACEYISLHLEDDLDVHLLAERAGYTDYYFTKKFRRETGVSVKEYILDKKLEKSCELLKNTNQNVQEISEKLGFKTHSYFGKMFKDKMGMSPSEYRNQG